MGYSEDDSMIRVDFFKPSGKWCCTEAVKWTELYREGYLPDLFAIVVANHLGTRIDDDHLAVCLEPFHVHAHPLMITIGRARAIARGEK